MNIYYSKELNLNSLEFLDTELNLKGGLLHAIPITYKLSCDYNEDTSMPVADVLILNPRILNDFIDMHILCDSVALGKKPKIVLMEQDDYKDLSFYRVPISWISLQLRSIGIEHLHSLSEATIYYYQKSQNASTHELEVINSNEIKRLISYDSLVETYLGCEEVVPV